MVSAGSKTRGFIIWESQGIEVMWLEKNKF